MWSDTTRARATPLPPQPPAPDLGIPWRGRALAIDIEPPGDECPGAANVDAGFIQGWYDGVAGAGYVPAYYGNGTAGSEFGSAWCAAVATQPAVGAYSYLWSFEPSLLGSYNRATAPGYSPNQTGCAGPMAAWQYQISAGSDPDVDHDEALSSLPLVVSTPVGKYLPHRGEAGPARSAFPGEGSAPLRVPVVTCAFSLPVSFWIFEPKGGHRNGTQRHRDRVRDDVTGTVREESHVTRDPGVGPVTDSQEVVSTITPARRAVEVCYLVFGIIDALLIIRLVLKLLAANPLAGFSSFVYGITDIFMAPFRNLLPAVTGGSGAVLEMSVVIAIIVYALIGWALARVIALMFARNVTVARRSSRDTGRPRPD